MLAGVCIRFPFVDCQIRALSVEVVGLKEHCGQIILYASIRSRITLLKAIVAAAVFLVADPVHGVPAPPSVDCPSLNQREQVDHS